METTVWLTTIHKVNYVELITIIVSHLDAILKTGKKFLEKNTCPELRWEKVFQTESLRSTNWITTLTLTRPWVTQQQQQNKNFVSKEEGGKAEKD